MLKVQLKENEDGTYSPCIDLDGDWLGFPLLELPQTRSLDDDQATLFIANIKDDLIEDLEERGTHKVLIMALKALPPEAIWSFLKSIWNYVLAQYAVLSGQVDFGTEDVD